MGAVVLLTGGCGDTTQERPPNPPNKDRVLLAQRDKRRALEDKLQHAQQRQRASRRAEQRAKRQARAEPSGATTLGAATSFAALQGSISAPIGLAITQLGSGATQTFGTLTSGHAWSTIKVPILVTLLRDRHEALRAQEQEWAAAAIEASDNEAAAALFQQLERIHGGLRGASMAVQKVMLQAGDSTTVATAPPPPGAFSTYGQTEWSLSEANSFFRALADGCLLGSNGTEYVLGLMRDVISEQRWGLGEAGFDPSYSVAFKGGWGPEPGGYLVRQSGLIRNGARGAAVTLIVEAGSFEAGTTALNQIAGWLPGHVRIAGPPGGC